MQVERYSGKRERKTVVTYLVDEDNPAKVGLILDGHTVIHIVVCKTPVLREGPLHYQLVGEVTAHQGFDG